MTTTTVDDNADLVRRLAAGMADHRWADVLTLVHRDVVAHLPAAPEPLRGVDSLAAFIVETSAKAEDGERFEVIDTLAGANHGAIYFRITANRPDRTPLDNLTVHLARIESGLVTEIWFHNFDNDAVAAFWA
ncbi:MAG: nuclear transport factor 2 family protein [Actinomycetota bacterium]